MARGALHRENFLALVGAAAAGLQRGLDVLDHLRDGLLIRGGDGGKKFLRASGDGGVGMQAQAVGDLGGDERAGDIAALDRGEQRERGSVAAREQREGGGAHFIGQLRQCGDDLRGDGGVVVIRQRGERGGETEGEEGDAEHGVHTGRDDKIMRLLARLSDPESSCHFLLSQSRHTRPLRHYSAPPIGNIATTALRGTITLWLVAAQAFVRHQSARGPAGWQCHHRDARAFHASRRHRRHHRRDALAVRASHSKTDARSEMKSASSSSATTPQHACPFVAVTSFAQSIKNHSP